MSACNRKPDTESGAADTLHKARETIGVVAQAAPAIADPDRERALRAQEVATLLALLACVRVDVDAVAAHARPGTVRVDDELHLSRPWQPMRRTAVLS